jgi:hypothetical protein
VYLTNGIDVLTQWALPHGHGSEVIIPSSAFGTPYQVRGRLFSRKREKDLFTDCCLDTALQKLQVYHFAFGSFIKEQKKEVSLSAFRAF